MSWQPLCGVDEAPFRGSPDALDSAVNSMRTIADTLQYQAAQLQSYMNSTGSWTGIAKDACVKTVSGLPGQLTSAHLKYSSAANALGPYSSTLRNAMARAESLRQQAEDAQRAVNSHTHDLQTQRAWEHNEATRAHGALADPTLGSPTPALWPGSNNSALLDGAKGTLASLRGQLAQLKAEVQGAASSAKVGINAAADIVRDDGGAMGFIKHSAVNVQRAAKWATDEARAHGLDLAALSATLGDLSGWLSIVGMIPIPGFQIFAAAGTVIGLVGVGIGLVTVLAGEKSFKDWAPGAAMSLLPFAAKGLKAAAVARSASEAGNVSAVAKNVMASGNKFSQLKSSWKVVGQAEKFESGVGQNAWVKLHGLESGLKPLENLHINNLISVLHGSSAANTATKIISMSQRGTIGHIATGVGAVEKAVDIKEKGATMLGLFNLATGPKEEVGASL